MKFKIKKAERNKHQELVSCVGWSNMNELFSVGDDQAIWKWDINGEAVSTPLPFTNSNFSGLQNHGNRSLSYLNGLVPNCERISRSFGTRMC